MRTKGATSNVIVKLSDLTRALGPDTEIPIARRFANALGLIGKPMAATSVNLNTVSTPEPETKMVEIVEDEPTGE